MSSFRPLASILGLLLLASVVAAEPFKVFRARGNVNVKDKNGNWRVIPGPGGADEVGDGECVKTGKDGEALLESRTKEGETRIGLGHDTEGKNGEEEEGGVKVPVFDLSVGSAYCSVLTKAKKQGVTFKIECDVGVVGVVGTEFLARKDSAGLSVVISESAGAVTDLEGKSAKVATGEAGFIRPWGSARFSGTGAAEGAALERLMAEIDRLALPGGGTVGDRTKADSTLAAKLSAAVAAAAKREPLAMAAGSTSLRLAIDGAALKKELEKILSVRLGRNAVGSTRTLPEGAMADIESFRRRFRE